MDVRVQPVDARWEKLGERDGTTPTGITLAADQGGPTTASFTMPRSAGNVYPDLASFSPVEFDHDGVLWDGRIIDAPEQADGTLAVQAEGWRAHLDDDALPAPLFAHTTPTDWRDQRTMPGANLARSGGFPSGGTLELSDGGLILGWPGGEPYTQEQRIGVTFDCGEDPENWARRVLARWNDGKNLPGASSTTFYCIVHDLPALNASVTAGAYTTVWGKPCAAMGTSGTLCAAVGVESATPRRYVTMYLHITSGGNGTISTDGAFFRFNELKVFASEEYESGNEGSVTFDQVVERALSAAPLLEAPTFRDAKFADLVLAHPTCTRRYRLNETSGTVAIDDSADGGPAQNGTYSGGGVGAGARVLDADPYDADAVSFRGGSGRKITLPSVDSWTAVLNAAAGGYSIEAVFTIASLPASYAMVWSFHGAASLGQSMGFGITSGGAWHLSHYGNNLQSANGLAVAGRSYHALVAYDSTPGLSRVWIYDDTGALVYSASLSGGFTPPGAQTIEIGHWTSVNSDYYWRGDIDEFALYKGPLRAHDALRNARAALFREDGDVQRGAYRLPSLAYVGQDKSARELIDAANAVHDFQWGVRPGRRVFAKFRPTSATLGTSSQRSKFRDATLHSAAEVVSKAVAQGTGPDGQPLRVVDYGAPAAVAVPNASADSADFSAWAAALSGGGANAASVLRATGTSHSAPASFLLSAEVHAGTGTVLGTWDLDTGVTFHPGRVYTVTLAYRMTGTDLFWLTTPGGAAVIGAPGADNAFGGLKYTGWTKDDTWRVVTVTWTQTLREPGILRLMRKMTAPGAGYSTESFYVDSIELVGPPASVPARRGFDKSKTLSVSQRATTPILRRLAQLYLSNHQATPMKGDLTAAPGTVDDLASASPVDVASLLNRCGEFVRIDDRADEVGGRAIREGRLVTVTYSHQQMTSGCSLDNQRGGFDVLLARYGVKAGG